MLGQQGFERKLGQFFSFEAKKGFGVPVGEKNVPLLTDDYCGVWCELQRLPQHFFDTLSLCHV
jgi:hypothetical protein